MEPAIVYHPNRRTRLLVCLSTRFAVSQKSVLANDGGANAARFATTLITYEVIKIWKALGTRALEAFFGIGK